MNDWRIIGTAPKDGTVFLAVDGDWVFQCIWCSEVSDWVRVDSDGYGPIKPVRQQDEAQRTFPTHWMPIPRVPRRAAQDLERVGRTHA